MNALRPLKSIFEAGNEAGGILPAELAEWYGSQLSLPLSPKDPYVIGNFITSLDGAIFPTEILFGDPSDRRLMSVLRTWAQAVIVGRETLDADPQDATWHYKTTAAKEDREAFQKFSENINHGKQYNVFVSNSGKGFDFTRGVFADSDVQAVIATTSKGQQQAKSDLAKSGVKSSVLIWDVGNDSVDLKALLEKLKSLGCTRVLYEGGASLYGSFEKAGLVDELFLARRPRVSGSAKNSIRKSFSNSEYGGGNNPLLQLRSSRIDQTESILFERWVYSK